LERENNVPLVLDFETAPYYAQVALFDPENPDSYPDWGTGDEAMVFGPSGVAVGTRPDLTGSVRIEVWTDKHEPSAPMRLAGEGVLRVSANQLTVGSVTGADLRTVPIPAVECHVSVYLHDSEDGPDAVVFVLQPSEE
jgi:hypothetical protein